MIRNPLGEADGGAGPSAESTSGLLPVVRIRHFGVNVFLHILYYVYQDSVEVSLVPKIRKPEICRLLQLLENAKEFFP